MNANINLRTGVDVQLVQHAGNDLSIIRAAKVSTAGPEVLCADPEGVPGLIAYLMKHRHGSPFEHASMTFAIRAPIFVFREWHRHRAGWSYNEESARYRQLAPDFWIPSDDRPIRPVEGFKAARPRFAADVAVADFSRTALASSYRLAYELYERQLAGGVAREVARACLPVGIYSSMFATCNPRSLMHFLSLRTHDEAARFVSYPQREIEECARMMEGLFANHFPDTYRAFCDNGRTAP